MLRASDEVRACVGENRIYARTMVFAGAGVTITYDRVRNENGTYLDGGYRPRRSVFCKHIAECETLFPVKKESYYGIDGVARE